MNITSSYSVEIKRCPCGLKETQRVFRQAVSYLIAVVDHEWSAIESERSANRRMMIIEHLVHTTKANVARYDFDDRFYKFPSYLRRSAIHMAVGAVSSHKSNLHNWENNGKQGKVPKLQADRFAAPTFYKIDMYKPGEEPDSVYLKLFVRNDWVWVKVRLLKTDVQYLQKYWSHCAPSAPTLEKRYEKYYLRFAFTENIKLTDAPVSEQRICAVDLGLNSDAVCSIMASNGTVLARRFIDFPSEKDHLGHVLNRIKRFQREHGSQNAHSFWAYAKQLNDELAKKVSSAIVEFAAQHNADCIVFEYLDFRRKKVSGSKAQKLRMWRKNGIQDYAEHKAHRCGIRVSRVCAWGTSRLAFDGSGELVRDAKNRALAVFRSGKQYNADLNASYNIGARYFIREIIKPLSVKAGSALSAKVPEVRRRTSCTLDTLLRVNAALAA